MNEKNIMYRLGIDTGGTFTDFTLFNEETREINSFKKPSTPKNPHEAIIDGIKDILANGISPEEISYFGHGTTVGTNAIIQLIGAKVGLITTSGFRDLLEIRRQKRPDLFDFYADKPPILVHRYLRKEVIGRINSDGQIIKNLNREEVLKAVKDLLDEGVESIAVCFLHSYLNQIHEIECKKYLEKIAPNIYVYLSSEVLPEFREYERLSTTVLCAYLGPIVYKYIQSLRKKTKEIGLKGEPYITKSNGGIMTCRSVKDKPIETALSGPASGVVASAYLGSRTGIKNLITFDLGGTSADISLIEDGIPKINTNCDVIGYPVKTPMIDLVTIGAGGGSIAWIDEGGALRVGPLSAGAVPGPACYGKGGENPTVTDANLVLGRINPHSILGGKMKMYPEFSRKVIEKNICKKLKMDLYEAAMGIIKIVNSNMLRAIRKVSVEKGYNPREFTFLSFGGGGGLHAVALAKELGCKEVLIPESPGTFSSFGLLVSDFRSDFVKTKILIGQKENIQIINHIFSDLETLALRWLRQQNVSNSKMVLKKYIDVRYQGQNYEHLVEVKEEKVTSSTIDQVLADFHQEHQERHGYSMVDNIVEFVNFRVAAYGIVSKPELKVYEKRSINNLEGSIKEFRQVFFEEENNFLKCPIYIMEELKPEDQFIGPAIIEQNGSTITIPPLQEVAIDKFKNIIIHIH